MIKRIAFLLILALILGACSSGASQAEVETAVKTAFEEYAESVKEGDVDRWIALWTEDGVRMPPGQPVTTGKDNIYSQVAGNLEVISWDTFEINVEEVRLADEWAFARGTYFASGALIAGGDPIEIDGKFMSVFQYQPDGSWKLHRDIFNSSQ